MLQRHRLIVGNWKMHKTVAEAKAFVTELESIRTKQAPPVPALETVLAPPFTALSAVAHSIKGRPYALAGQNLFWEDKGAFTGEISGGMLKELGCRYVIIGHSERRRYFGETDNAVHKKLGAALRHGLRAIVCIGETWDQRLSDQTDHILTHQLEEALTGVEKNQASEIVIAYEPVWAIGSGVPATPTQVQEVHRDIRTQLIAFWGQDAGSLVPILYGGSVTPENIGELIQLPDVDGALVGGACLDPVLFARILEIAGALSARSS
jgi:triosephosphate isomerase